MHCTQVWKHKTKGKFKALVLIKVKMIKCLLAGAIYGFWKRKTECRKIPNHVIEAVRKIEDRKQIEHAK